MARLLIRSPHSGEESVVDLSRSRISIGRSARNDICLDDPFASRLHAEVRRLGDHFCIQDLGSANGTMINGRRLTGSAELHDRDQVRIGETVIEYSERGETSPGNGRTSVLVSDGGSVPGPEMTISPSRRNSAAELLTSIESDGTKTVTVVSSAPLPVKDALSTISRVSLTLLTPLTLDETLQQVLECVFDVISADRGYVMMVEPGGTEQNLVCKARKVRGESGAGAGSKDGNDRQDGKDGNDSREEVRISQTISDHVLKQGSSILTSDALHDPRFQRKQSVLLGGLRSVMAVPLAVENRISGMIYVDNLFHINRFNERDLEMLTLIASVAAIRIENMSLLELQQEQRRLANELAVASEIQLGLHPSTPPVIPGYDLIGVSFPCYEVGGDYYDFIGRSDGRFVIAVGDVSGKGTGAALLMSSVHAAVRAHSRTRLAAVEVVTEINYYIHENTPPNRYVTLFYSELDPRTHKISYINAGHNSPILLRATGEVTRLDIGGFPVGITPYTDYREGWVGMEPGDILAIYSDGVTESLNEEDEEFDEGRLIETISRNRQRTAAGIRDRIDEELTKFVGRAKTVDDLTLVIVKRVT